MCMSDTLVSCLPCLHGLQPPAIGLPSRYKPTKLRLTAMPSQMLCLGAFAIPRFYDPKRDPEGAHLADHVLIQVLPQALAMRRFAPVSALQLAKGYYDSPCPSQPLAICFVQVSSSGCACDHARGE